ncbi:MAG: addiction module protein [Planctomycetes bacterium]|nr:addiction module protein [Planctomycetota bacterium]
MQTDAITTTIVPCGRPLGPTVRMEWFKDTLQEVMVTNDRVLSKFRQLSVAEQLRLVQDLWDEIAAGSTGLPLPDAHRKLLDERLREHESDPGGVEPWEKVRDSILGEL